MENMDLIFQFGGKTGSFSYERSLRCFVAYVDRLAISRKEGTHTVSSSSIQKYVSAVQNMQQFITGEYV